MDPATSMIAGSFLAAFLQVFFDRIASRQVVDFFKRKILKDIELKRLRVMMITMIKMLDDAEEKQIADSSARMWMDEVHDTFYNADDLLDRIAFETLQLEQAGASSQTRRDQVLNLVSSHNPFGKEKEEMGNELKQLIEMLKFLFEQKDALRLGQDNEGRTSSSRTPTTSVLVDEAGVYIGRDDDKKAMMELLCQDAKGEPIVVIYILGMWGVGKTTLAQILYNDSLVTETFDLKIWVFVSENFDVLKVIRDILKEIGSLNCDTMTANQLHCKLEKELEGQKLLLVLDDVWKHDREIWDFLLAPFKTVAAGSKILVTTSNESVASAKSPAAAHRLEKLNADSCWLVFARYAFADASSSSCPELEAIGKKVVDKNCNGLPPLAKALGCLMGSNRDAEEWEKMSKKNLWELSNYSVLPALRLSYKNLPSQLKLCFAYCGIFARDFVFEREGLILLWIAEGFLFSSRGNQEMAEAGVECFHQLVSMSFFQQHSSRNPSWFVMPSVTNDLAKSLFGQFFFRLENDNSRMITERTRHLSFKASDNDLRGRFEGLHRAIHLRTFLPLPKDTPSLIDDKVIQGLLQKHRRLRVLSLAGYNNVSKLDDSIGKLIHLRYLNLRNTAIKRLPASVVSLSYLQILILRGCIKLVELPTDTRRLSNLFHLDIEGTKLQEMPPQMGQLRRLQTLTDFIVGKRSGSGIKELEKLQELKGTLSISNLQNVKNPQDAEEAKLKEKTLLKRLKFGWDGGSNGSPNQREVLEKLEPHANTKSLCIEGYGGTTFPDWLGYSSFSKIEDLELRGCAHCISLPPLRQLASLKTLRIQNCPKLQALPELPSLNDLFINTCLLLEGRCERQTGGDWMKISHIPNIEIDGRKI